MVGVIKRSFSFPPAGRVCCSFGCCRAPNAARQIQGSRCLLLRRVSVSSAFAPIRQPTWRGFRKIRSSGRVPATDGPMRRGARPTNTAANSRNQSASSFRSRFSVPATHEQLTDHDSAAQSLAAASTNSRAICSSRATISGSVPGLPGNRAISSTPGRGKAFAIPGSSQRNLTRALRQIGRDGRRVRRRSSRLLSRQS